MPEARWWQSPGQAEVLVDGLLGQTRRRRPMLLLRMLHTSVPARESSPAVFCFLSGCKSAWRLM